ncbi:MAG: hypothetical protein Q7V56_07775 [Gammaproteobacteria bacterium]|nr:hypothetical protein [Gammaproteobacteria bacterium]
MSVRSFSKVPGTQLRPMAAAMQAAWAAANSAANSTANAAAARRRARATSAYHPEMPETL